MAVKVLIPTPLRNLTNQNAEVSIEGGGEVSLYELIESLESKFPGIKDRICEEGKIRRFINIFVNGEDIRFLDGEKTKIKDGDEVSIIPAIAGGDLNGKA